MSRLSRCQASWTAISVFALLAWHSLFLLQERRQSQRLQPALLLGSFPKNLSFYNLHMRYARVGDAVWYRMGGELQEKAEILAFEKAATQAVILLLTGPQRGQTPDAPKGTLEPLMIRETDGEYDVEVRVRVDRGFFTDRGFIRKSNLAGDLTFEISFESGERQPSAEAALETGMVFARRKIDEMWAVD